jgi:hypothetical protein
VARWSRAAVRRGWKRTATELGTVEIVPPDGQAGAFIDNRNDHPYGDTMTL